MDWTQVAEQVLDGTALTREQALRALTGPPDELLSVLQAAYAVRERVAGRVVRVNVLLSAKSGACPEDCAFCSQSSRATGGKRPLTAAPRSRAGRPSG